MELNICIRIKWIPKAIPSKDQFISIALCECGELLIYLKTR